MEGNGVMDGDGHGNMNGVGSMERDVNMDGDGLGVGGMDEDMGVGLGTWGMKLELEMGSCSVLAHPRAPNVPLLGTPQEATHRSALPPAIWCMGGEESSPLLNGDFGGQWLWCRSHPMNKH